MTDIEEVTFELLPPCVRIESVTFYHARVHLFHGQNCWSRETLHLAPREGWALLFGKAAGDPEKTLEKPKSSHLS